MRGSLRISISSAPQLRRDPRDSGTEPETARTAIPDLGDQPDAVRELSDLLQLVVRAQKALHLYQGRNRITDRLEEALFAELSERLDLMGPLKLSVREFQILVGEDVVYENRDRYESLAFLLFRDGIRSLTFFPELERKELHDFLLTLNRVRVLGATPDDGSPDDLVTLLWDRDFKAIRYFAVDELAGTPIGPLVEDQLASGRVEPSFDPVDPSEHISVEDLQQTVSRIPTESVHLSEEEIDALRDELMAERHQEGSTVIVELAIELTMLETDAKERSRLAEQLLGILDALLEEGEAFPLFQAFEHLAGLTKSLFSDREPVVHLLTEVTAALAEPQRINRVLEIVDGKPAVSPDPLRAYLARLAEPALPSLVPWLGRLKKPALRRATAEAIRTVGEKCLPELARHVTTSPLATPVPRDFAVEVLYLVRHLPEEAALPILWGLLHAGDPAVRKDAALTLGHFRSAEADSLWLDLLEDYDPVIRGLAVTALLRIGNRELAHQMLERVSGSQPRLKRDLDEYRRIFAAVARLAGEDALGWFEELLRPAKKRWFVSPQQYKVERAAAHGILTVGSERAQHLVSTLTESGDRYVRVACLQELGGSPTRLARR